MKRTISSFLLPLASLFSFAVSFAQEPIAQPSAVPQPVVRSEAVPIATALDHLTVLEFDEAVTQTAAGSSAFTIEWRDNKVLIKPLKPGVSTDLFVWTASRRFTYELGPPGAVKNMNFAIDEPSIKPKPLPAASDEQITRIADMTLTRALLGAGRIDSGHISTLR